MTPAEALAMRDRLYEYPANHSRKMGWTVGTILEGSPIILDGKKIEDGLIIQITAIGENLVLAKRLDKSWRESSWEFTSREWKEVHNV